MKKHFKTHRFIVIIFVIFCSLHVTQASPSFAGETNIYLIGEYFDWQEFVDNKKFVRESGLRFGIGLAYNYNFKFYDNQLILKPHLELIGGQIDYDSSTNSNIPVKSDSDYYDGKVELDLGWRIGSLKKVTVEPFVGIGFRGWYRNIRDAVAADGITNIYGYPEEWYSIYFRAGLRGDVALWGETRLFVEAGGKYPVYNRNTARFDKSDLGPAVTFEPGNEISWFAETGVKYKLFKASFYYDSMRFSKSDIEYSRGIGYYQPKSEADMYGIRVGMAF